MPGNVYTIHYEDGFFLMAPSQFNKIKAFRLNYFVVYNSTSAFEV